MTQHKETQTTNLQKKWMLIEFQKFSKEDLIKHNAYIDFSELEKAGRGTAKMGCNNIFFQTKIKKHGEISFSNAGSTMMACDEETMKLENQFSKILPNISSYKIEGHFLFLSNQSGDSMKLVAEDWD